MAQFQASEISLINRDFREAERLCRIVEARVGQESFCRQPVRASALQAGLDMRKADIESWELDGVCWLTR